MSRRGFFLLGIRKHQIRNQLNRFLQRNHSGAVTPFWFTILKVEVQPTEHRHITETATNARGLFVRKMGFPSSAKSWLAFSPDYGESKRS